MRRATWVAAAAWLTAGCSFLIFNSEETVVQSDLRLPKGTRIALLPLALYGYSSEQVTSMTANLFSGVSGPLMSNGFHVVERSLVEKAVSEYGKTKTVGQLTPGAAVYQDQTSAAGAQATAEGTGERIIDAVDVGRTLNVRLVLAGSLQSQSRFMASAADVRMRVVDVLNGELIAHCQAEGRPDVVALCSTKIAKELSSRMQR